MAVLTRENPEAGFTFIEVVVTVFIVAIAAVSMLQGVVYAKEMLRSIRLEHRALEELHNYVEEYRAVISVFGGSNRRYIIAPNQPTKVLLTDETNTEEQTVYGYIDRETVQERTLGNAYRNTPYYKMKAWIEWDETPHDGKDNERRLELEVSMFQFP